MRRGVYFLEKKIPDWRGGSSIADSWAPASHRRASTGWPGRAWGRDDRPSFRFLISHAATQRRSVEEVRSPLFPTCSARKGRARTHIIVISLFNNSE